MNRTENDPPNELLLDVLLELPGAESYDPEASSNFLNKLFDMNSCSVSTCRAIFSLSHRMSSSSFLSCNTCPSVSDRCFAILSISRSMVALVISCNCFSASCLRSFSIANSSSNSLHRCLSFANSVITFSNSFTISILCCLRFFQK